MQGHPAQLPRTCCGTGLPRAQGCRVPAGCGARGCTVVAQHNLHTPETVFLMPTPGLIGRRMRDHCWTQGGQLRFYCGAPLVAANNHRIGTLCARQPCLQVHRM